MKVVVLGAGALGTLYGGWIADAGHDVTLVGRAAHCAAVNANGLQLVDRLGVTRQVRVHAVEHAVEAPDCDVLLLASKSQDTSSLLSRYVGRVAAAWSVQNGVRQAEPLVERFGSAAIGCSSMVGATLLEPGVVRHTFTGSTYVGRLATSAPDAVDTVIRSLPGDVIVEVRDDITSVLWSKAVLAAGAMGLSALLRLAYHHVFIEPGAREVFLDVVSEAAEVAAAGGVTLVDFPGPLQIGSMVAIPRGEALARLAALGASMVASGQTSVRVSMLQSIDSNRPLEVQAVFGDLVRLADHHHLGVPLLRAVTQLVTSLDSVIRQGANVR
jgi:2-dehydropantoate 2-reductase